MSELSEAKKRIQELEAELRVSDELIKDRDALLEAIPQCPAHGKCVPFALEWIAQAKTLAKIAAGANTA